MTTKTIKFVIQYKYNKCGGLDMQNLKSNIDHYMELKGIRMYSHLLVDIAHELGIKGQEAYKFAKNKNVILMNGDKTLSQMKKIK